MPACRRRIINPFPNGSSGQPRGRNGYRPGSQGRPFDKHRDPIAVSPVSPVPSACRPAWASACPARPGFRARIEAEAHGVRLAPCRIIFVRRFLRGCWFGGSVHSRVSLFVSTIPQLYECGRFSGPATHCVGPTSPAVAAGSNPDTPDRNWRSSGSDASTRPPASARAAALTAGAMARAWLGQFDHREVRTGSQCLPVYAC
jgi:hypothetical protein